MEETNPFVNFVRYIEAERKILNFRDRYNHLERDIKDNEDLIKDRTLSVENLKNNAQKLNRQVHLYELDVKSKRDRRKELQRKLDTVSNPKEYAGYTKELEELDKNENATEDLMLQRLQEYERASKDYEEHKRQLQEWLKIHHNLVDDKKREAHDLNVTIAVLEQERSVLEQKVSAEFLHDYYRMRQAVRDPFVPVIDNHCSACHCEISAHDMSSLKRHIFANCKNCYRKLYLTI